MKRNHLAIRRVILILLVCLIPINIMAQKVDHLDTLNIDQLNLYKDKAVKMRNTGRALTIAGAGVVATGIVIGIIFWNIPGEPGGDMDGLLAGFYVMGIGGLVGIPCAAAGIPLWAVGSSRKTKADLNLQKFNIAPQGSMAFGLGLTIRF